MPGDRLCTMDVDFIITAQLVEAPRCFTSHPSPRLQSLIDGFTRGLQTQTQTNAQFLFITLPLTFGHLRHNLNRTLTYVKTTSIYSCTQTHSHAHIQTRSFTHVLTHTNLGWLPSCASCFFHQHVFTGRGPLCLHYREAINRKASPGVWKLLFGGNPHEERALIIVWFSL